MNSQDSRESIGLQPHAPFCVSCQAPLTGAFCAHCGEKVITRHDYSLAHFVEHGLETLTHFDFKIFSTLKTLIVKPGQLTLDYLQGRRKGRVPPIQLFVLINIAFAFLVHFAGITPFTTRLNVQQNDPPFVAYKVDVISRAIEASGLTAEEFGRSFNKTAELQGKAWVITLIPMFALLFAMLYGFRRWYYEMLVFSTHYCCFMLLWLVSSSFVARYVYLLFNKLWQFNLSGSEYEFLISCLGLGGVAIYQYLAQRRAFADQWWSSLLRAVTVLVLFIFPLMLYRFLLFFLTLWAM